MSQRIGYSQAEAKIAVKSAKIQTETLPWSLPACLATFECGCRPIQNRGFGPSGFFLGRVYGFDQDDAEGERDVEVMRRLFAHCERISFVFRPRFLPLLELLFFLLEACFSPFLRSSGADRQTSSSR